MSNHIEPEKDKVTRAENIVIPVGVAFGIIITTLLLCGAGFGASIWWASDVSSSLKTLVKQGNDRDIGAVALGTRLTALELWQHEVSVSGTPALARETVALRGALDKLSSEFEIYRATSKKP